MKTPPLAQSIGAAERSMRALLERQLRLVGLSFSEWTILVFTSASPLTSDEIAQRQLHGRIVEARAETDEAIRRLSVSGLLFMGPGHAYSPTSRGAVVHQDLSNQVETITTALYASLPIDALEVTHQTLTEVARRAIRMLAR